MDSRQAKTTGERHTMMPAYTSARHMSLTSQIADIKVSHRAASGLGVAVKERLNVQAALGCDPAVAICRRRGWSRLMFSAARCAGERRPHLAGLLAAAAGPGLGRNPGDPGDGLETPAAGRRNDGRNHDDRWRTVMTHETWINRDIMALCVLRSRKADDLSRRLYRLLTGPHRNGCAQLDFRLPPVGARRCQRRLDDVHEVALLAGDHQRRVARHLRSWAASAAIA